MVYFLKNCQCTTTRKQYMIKFISILKIFLSLDALRSSSICNYGHRIFNFILTTAVTTWSHLFLFELRHCLFLSNSITASLACVSAAYTHVLLVQSVFDKYIRCVIENSWFYRQFSAAMLHFRLVRHVCYDVCAWKGACLGCVDQPERANSITWWGFPITPRAKKKMPIFGTQTVEKYSGIPLLIANTWFR